MLASTQNNVTPQSPFLLPEVYQVAEASVGWSANLLGCFSLSCTERQFRVLAQLFPRPFCLLGMLRACFIVLPLRLNLFRKDCVVSPWLPQPLQCHQGLTKSPLSFPVHVLCKVKSTALLEIAIFSLFVSVCKSFAPFHFLVGDVRSASGLLPHIPSDCPK